ncbi:MAG TPA: dicarboxylate/amino acid:cation symporter [Gemmatimonadaceae bacterium]|nr:dicarboxylate/amino acid:cation symporter [Gemmatimonadaceae bacterium]
MSLTVRVLIGLGLGFGAGLIAADVPQLARAATWIAPAGTIFINAIQMTVIPLVVSSLVLGVASAPDSRAVGRLGGRAAVLFVLLVFVSSVIGVVVAPGALALNAPDAASIEALRASTQAVDAVERAKAVPTFTQWLLGLVPVNPVRAAAESAMLPLIVFSLLFGVALTRVDAARRDGLMRALAGLQDASFVLVRWILMLAPIGVFALAVPLAARVGLEAVRAIAWYMAVVSGLCVLFMALVLYPLASVVGRIPLREFARAALPVQAVAISARSSMASLPVMINEFAGSLGLSKEITGFLLPLSSSVFRAGAGIGIAGGVCFLAILYGSPLSLGALATIAVTTTLLSFSIPGIPAGSIIAMVPVLQAANLPVEGVAILIAADAIPDMLRTTTNVTGTMAVAAMLGGRTRTAAPTTNAA